MDRVAVFVDAGYLFAQGSVELCGKRITRRNIDFDHKAVTDTLKAFAEAVSKLPLLRIYWYDGTSQGPTGQHIALAGQVNVKIRLGFVNSRGQQKGVDSLMVTDMITLARNQAMAECVLLSGDEDIRVGVQQAQEYGVRVHLLGIKPARGSQSQSALLLQEADATHFWTASDLKNFLHMQPDLPPLDSAATPEPFAGADATGLLEDIARQVANGVAKSEVSALVNDIRATSRRPQDIDGKLLGLSRQRLGKDLDEKQKYKLRTTFLIELEARINELPDTDT